MNNNNNSDSNNLDDDDDLYTIVEPIESYQSSSTNCGVSTIISSRQIRPLKQLDMLLTPCSHNSSFSLCNTIMLPCITTEESIDCYSKRENNISSTNEVSNTNGKSELVHSETLKESQHKHIKLEKEKSPKNTISLKDVKRCKEKGFKKNNFSSYQNSFLLAKNLSYNNGNINKIDINININEIKKINLNNATYHNNNNESNSNSNSNSNNNNNNNSSRHNNNQTNKNKKKEHIIKDHSRIEEENESFVQRKYSMRVGENKNHISDMDKSDNNLKKIRKVKIKNSLLGLKSKLKAQDCKKREDPSLEKSKSLIDEKNSKKNKKMESDLKIKTSKNFSNSLQIKIDEKAINENYKKFKKKNTKEIKDEDEDENSDDESMKKNNKKKKIKNNKNDENKKDWKVNKFRHFGNKMKINKSFHIKANMNIIREIIKNRKDKNKEKDKKSDDDNESDNDNDNDNDSESQSDDNCKEKDKNSKIEKRKDKDKEFNRKFYIKKSTMNNDKRKEEDKLCNMKRNADRQKTFTNEYFKKLRFSKKEDKKEEKREENEKIQKQKIKKEKEKNKNKDRDRDKYDSFNISFPQKHFYTTTKNIFKYDIKPKDSAINNTQNVLRKERSNSLILKKSEIDINKKKINLSNSLKDIKIKKKTNKKVIDFENALQNNNNKKKMQFNLFSQDKFTNTEFSDSDYLKYTLNCMDLILDIDMEKQSRIKNKINFNFQKLKKKSIKKKIALFDLDETLVHCTGDIKTTKEKYQNIIEIKLPGRQEIKVGINVRPLWKQTLNLIKKNYHIVIYTASHQAYADAVLDFMDPKKKYFKYRLYRNNCSLLDIEGAKFYVKDLEILNEHYNLKDIVIIDNSVLSFAFHLHNGIPIVPYYDEDKDGSLYVVGLYLMHIYNEDDLREANKKHINLDSFLQEAKRKKEESISMDEDSDESYDTVENEDNVNIDINNTQNIPENKSKSDKTNNVLSFVKRSSLKENSKKFSEKKVNFNVKKKKSISELSAVLQRKKSSDFTKNKLKSQSKLLTMYYELNDESTKSIEKLNLNMRKSNANAFYDYKLREKILNNNLNSINTKNDVVRTESHHPTVILVDNENENENDNNDDMECKTDRNYENKKWNDFEIKKLEEIQEVPVLTRGVTMKPDLVQDAKNEVNKTKIKSKKSIEINNKLKSQMGYIRSNFFNTFKI